ncbi:MAG: tetratricopeptide repeat protein [bacterium]
MVKESICVFAILFINFSNLFAQIEYQPSYEDLIYDAESAFNEGDYSKALELLTKALQIQPGSQSAWELLGDSYVGQGSFTLANDAYKNAIKKGKATLELYKKYADVVSRIGTDKEKEIVYKEWAKSYPQEVEPHLVLLEIYRAKGDKEGIQIELEALLGAGVENYDYYIELAKIYESKKMIDKAIDKYKLAIDFDPKHIDAHLKLGDILWSKGNLKEALYEFEDVLRYFPELSYGHYGLGMISYETGDYTTAMAELQIIIDKSRENEYKEELGDRYFKALSTIAEIYNKMRMYEDVVVISDRAKELGYEDDRLWYLAGDCLLNLGEKKRAEELLKEAVSLNPRNSNAYLDLGRIYFDDGDFRSSANSLEMAVKFNDKLFSAYLLLGHSYLKLNNEDLAYSNFMKAEALSVSAFEPQFEIGKILVLWERYSDALLYLEKAKQNNPKSAEVFFYIGNSYKGIKNLDKAIENYEQATFLDRNHYLAYASLGDIYVMKGDFECALVSYEQSFKIKDDYVPAYIGFAKVNEDLQYYETASSAFSKALDFENDNIVALVGRGRCEYKMEKFDQAEKDLKRAIDLNTNLSEPHFYLGRVYEAKENFNDAIDEYHKAGLLDPYNFDAFYREGFLLLRVKKDREAIQPLEIATKIKPESIDANLLLAIAYENYDMIDNALKVYKKLAVLEPNNKEHYRNIGEIERLKNAYDNSISAFRKILEIDRNDANAYEMLGDLYRIKGYQAKEWSQYKEELKWLDMASETYQQFLTIKPNAETAPYIQQFIEGYRKYKSLTEEERKITKFYLTW